MIFLKSTKTGQACESFVLNCDLTERLFYCAWAPPGFYTAKTRRRHWPTKFAVAHNSSH